MAEYNYRFDSRPSRQLLTDTVTKHMMDNCSRSINVSYAMVQGRIEIRSGDFLIGLCIRVDGVHLLLIKPMTIINTYLMWGRRRAEQAQRDEEVRERSMRHSSERTETVKKHDYSKLVNKGEHTYRGREKARENFFKLTDIDDAILLSDKEFEFYNEVRKGAYEEYKNSLAYSVMTKFGAQNGTVILKDLEKQKAQKLRGKYNPHYRPNDSEPVIIDDPEGERRSYIKMMSGGRGSGKADRARRTIEELLRDDVEGGVFSTRGAAEFAAKTNGRNLDYTVEQHRDSDDDDAMWWFTIKYNKKTEREEVRVWYDEAIDSPSMKNAKIVTGSAPDFVPRDVWDGADGDNINNLERELAVEQGELGKFFKKILNIRRRGL